MRLSLISLMSLLVLFILSFVCTTSLGYVPPDNYLIDCGSRFNTTVDTRRVFVSDDSTSRMLSTPQTIIANTTTIPSGVYRTARIFTEDSSYTFRIQRPGRHWIRLHFYPFVYQTYDMSNADFSVSTQQFLLLSSFQPSNASDVKEFSVNVTSDSLVIRFTPKTGSFAFLNALEVVSVPDTLITEGVQTINPVGTFQGIWRQALETSYRLNMGGPFVSPSNDTLGRTWVSGDRFLRNPNLGKSVSNVGAVKWVDQGATSEIAPDAVYGTATEMNMPDVPNGIFNVTWEFEVDPEFEYLVRFHFCDIVSISLNQLSFNVYLASRMVLPNFDLSLVTFQTLGGALYRDFIVQMGNTRMLSVSIGPSSGEGVQPNAILNGLEVMKMNNSRGGLDVGTIPAVRSQSKPKTAMIAGVVAGLLVLLIAAMIVCLMCRRRRIQTEHSKTWVPFSTNGGTVSQSLASKFFNGTRDNTGTDLGYRIPFLALQEATNKFNESWVIGVGGFGKVYKGVLKDGTKIAVKRGNPQSQQGLAEFRTEIEMLSQFRHRHLVSLIGYCDERNEMILIYEYMENGTLKSHLYGSEFPSMDWKQRLEICIGSARGLHYLHTGSTKAVIHRDVKSANILLDENLMAKVADFGLSKAGPDIDQTHVSTAVKGSFGYLDPEYFRRQQLTEKSDVYSFGVVLFEVLCARPVIDPSLPRDKVNLAEWAMKYQTSGKLEQIIDPFLVGKVRPDSLRKFGETAEKCLAEYGVDRPSMADVLWNLEYALQLQEAGNQSEPCDNSTNQIGDISPLIHHDSFVETSATAEQFRQLEDISGTSMSRVFSQLVKAEGR